MPLFRKHGRDSKDTVNMPDPIPAPTPKDVAEQIVQAVAKRIAEDPILSRLPWALVRRHPEGGYAVVHGFVEDTHIPDVDPDVHSSFMTLQAAADEAAREGYYSLHPECHRPPARLVKGL